MGQPTVMIFAGGSRGDVQPCLALGQALLRQGIAVRVLASMRYEDLAAEAGVRFHPLPVDPAAVIESVAGQELLSGRKGPVSFIRRMNRVLRPCVETILEQAQACARGADLVLAPTLGLFGVHLSQSLGVPHAVMHFQPSQPTGAFPHPFVPARTLGSLGNRASYDVVDIGTWLLSRRYLNRWRAEERGLPPMPLLSPLRASRRATVLCAFSPTVVERPADWGPNVHVTGFWSFERPGWTPPHRLRAFLGAGSPPVYVGFGSMRTPDPHRTDRSVRAALRRAGLRGVLAGDPATSEDDMLVVSDTPHEWLFPRMAAVVHHGGAGTAFTALRAGVPSMACPFFGDQPYWGARIHRLGAGPRPLPARDLTASELAQRLTALTGSTVYADGAQRLGDALRAEDGAGRACRVLERTLCRR
ncbi:glycosyltransferase [Streptomyces sp. SS7]|uniref:glycosyltransferase n=1 Tax=Streptomyces sp. SS7 TaxID=3108485 RepID=UPI0030EC91CD